MPSSYIGGAEVEAKRRRTSRRSSTVNVTPNVTAATATNSRNSRAMRAVLSARSSVIRLHLQIYHSADGKKTGQVHHEQDDIAREKCGIVGNIQVESRVAHK